MLPIPARLACINFREYARRNWVDGGGLFTTERGVMGSRPRAPQVLPVTELCYEFIKFMGVFRCTGCFQFDRVWQQVVFAGDNACMHAVRSVSGSVWKWFWCENVEERFYLGVLLYGD